ncbi:hypothetical protein PO909_020764 [Leuciscus waleckii]
MITGWWYLEQGEWERAPWFCASLRAPSGTPTSRQWRTHTARSSAVTRAYALWRSPTPLAATAMPSSWSTPSPAGSRWRS